MTEQFLQLKVRIAMLDRDLKQVNIVCDNYQVQLKQLCFENAKFQKFYEFNQQQQKQNSSEIILKEQSKLPSHISKSQMKTNKTEEIKQEAQFQKDWEEKIIKKAQEFHSSIYNTFSSKKKSKFIYSKKKIPKTMKSSVQFDPLKQIIDYIRIPEEQDQQDNICSNLIKKINLEQQQLVSALSNNRNLCIRKKIKKSLQEKIDKNEQLLIKIKQSNLQLQKKPLESNKTIVKIGYTESMKKLITTSRLNNL